MARVLAISSEVVRGHIGLRAIVPALQALGHEVWPLPTIVLSNHPGHAQFEKIEIAASRVTALIEALDANGWLDSIDAVVTGYLPTRAHVEAVAKMVRRLKARRRVTYLCDPILGDDPKGLYIDAGAAAAIKDRLVPLADIVTPNRFELGWLLEMPLPSLGAVEAAARALGVPMVVVTSAAQDEDRLATVLATAQQVLRCWTPYVADAAHGTGDLLSGIFLGQVLHGLAPAAALGRSVGSVAQVIAASQPGDELDLAGAGRWADAPSAEVEAVWVGDRG